MAVLPPALEQALLAQPPGLGKRERTRRQLLLAALQVLAARGVAAATVQEVAQTAGVTTGTVYNHFDTKDAVVQAVGEWLADTLCRAIRDSQASAAEGSERMAIGQRRYIGLAQHSPDWALLFLDVANAAPAALAAKIAAYASADLKLGMAQGAFKVADEAAALDLILGVPSQAMRSVALGLTQPGHDVRVTALLLRGLGMSEAKAAEVAARPLPPLVASTELEQPTDAATALPKKTRPAGVRVVAPTQVGAKKASVKTSGAGNAEAARQKLPEKRPEKRLEKLPRKLPIERSKKPLNKSSNKPLKKR